MSTMPKVSVVTTTYNDMDNLCRIMEEVRKQTYKNIEHIIVDGGSTDGTVEMLTRLSEEQPGAFRWISEPDDGIYDLSLSEADSPGSASADIHSLHLSP